MLDLYLTSRRTSRALLGIVASAVLAWLLLAISSNPQFIRPIQIVVPLIPAVVIGGSTWSPFGEAEHTASRLLLPLRAIHLGGLLACAAVTLGLASLGEPGTEARWVLLRNLAGYSGLACIGSRLVGPMFASIFAWALPLTYVALIWAVDAKLTWAWAKQASTEGSATVIAITLLAIGLLLILPAGTWRRANEGDVV